MFSPVKDYCYESWIHPIVLQLSGVEAMKGDLKRAE